MEAPDRAPCEGPLFLLHVRRDTRCQDLSFQVCVCVCVCVLHDAYTAIPTHSSIKLPYTAISHLSKRHEGVQRMHVYVNSFSHMRSALNRHGLLCLLWFRLLRCRHLCPCSNFQLSHQEVQSRVAQGKLHTKTQLFANRATQSKCRETQ